ncbi:non-specific lipid-transfer protein A-like [Prosopis cineraria]|uniref:non-specific lipid-transfer protein A-like n=1 Tax=Prosopis cineraria TaxID=364024 RepID=UPI0024103EEA|nr:non-specific lipid-transfer protein A-like [Prosopis cineraria]
MKSNGAKKAAAAAAAAVAIWLVVTMTTTEMVKRGEALNCSTIGTAFYMCFLYMEGEHFQEPPPECCDGLRVIKKEIGSSRDDCRAGCECLKYAASLFPKLQKQRAEALPGLCHEDVCFPPITNETDCSQVKRH